MQGQIDKLATADQLKEKVSELQALISSNQTGISSLETKLAEVKATADSKAYLGEASFSRSLAFSFLSFRKVSRKFLRAFLILPVLPLPKRCFFDPPRPSLAKEGSTS